ncbi:MAG: hypothetical protein JXR77_10490, partial [Lentisphaeria bacterium]|nr:hypothetical protein [Lentisphaeria bacterium]
MNPENSLTEAAGSSADAAGAVTARVSRRWLLRMVLVALAGTAFAGWCLVDAKVAYPRFNLRAAEHNRLLLAREGDRWSEVAARNGWRTEFRKEDRNPDGTIVLKTPLDIGCQYVMMVLCLGAVAAIALRVLQATGRSMRADDTAFHTIDGVTVPYGDVLGLDFSRWQRKSIVTVRYRDGAGTRTTRIDDWVYQGGEDVLREIRKHTGLGQDSPGRPAPESRASAAEAEAHPARPASTGRPADAPGNPTDAATATAPPAAESAAARDPSPVGVPGTAANTDPGP